MTKTNLQIRGVPVALREKVRARAAKKGQTMSQYVTEVLQRETAHLSLDEWLDLVRRNRIPVHGGMTGAEAVREAREERAEQLARDAEERAKRAQR